MNQHRRPAGAEEGAGLIAHAADSSRAPPLSPFRTYDEEQAHYESDTGYRGAAGGATGYPSQTGYGRQQAHPHAQYPQVASADDSDFAPVPEPRVNMEVMAGRPEDAGGSAPPRPPPPSDMQRQVGAALWGQNPHQHPDGAMM